MNHHYSQIQVLPCADGTGGQGLRSTVSKLEHGRWMILDAVCAQGNVLYRCERGGSSVVAHDI
eukprot:343660-Chlamydomonas_euryale.AAC.10